MKEYALYKGDELLGIGTLKELAEKKALNLAQFISTFHQHIKNVVMGKTEKY